MQTSLSFQLQSLPKNEKEQHQKIIGVRNTVFFTRKYVRTFGIRLSRMDGLATACINPPEATWSSTFFWFLPVLCPGCVIRLCLWRRGLQWSGHFPRKDSEHSKEGVMDCGNEGGSGVFDYSEVTSFPLHGGERDKRQHSPELHRRQRKRFRLSSS